MSAGLFIRSQLKDIISTSTRHFIYHIHNDKSIKPIISANKIRWNYEPVRWTEYDLPEWAPGLSEAHDSSEDAFNMVSADHCQNMDDNFIVTFSPISTCPRGSKRKKENTQTRTYKRRKTQKAGRKKASKKKTRLRKKKRKKNYKR